jgi:hypothetical protein
MKAPNELVGTWLLTYGLAPFFMYGATMSSFIASPQWGIGSVCLSGVFSICLFVWAYKTTPSGLRFPYRGFISTTPAWRGVEAALVGFIVFFPILTGCVPIIPNIFIGTYASKDVMIVRWTKPKPGTRPIGSSSLPPYVFWGWPYSEKEAPAGTWLKLEGKASWFGMNVTKMTIIKQPSDQAVPRGAA